LSASAYPQRARLFFPSAPAPGGGYAAPNAELLQQALEDLKQLRTLLYSDPALEPPPPHY
jgi:hypothetical protein